MIEIIVADGMSTDGTREIIRQYQERFPQIHLVDNPKQIVPTGINTAIRQAAGNIIVRIDGHTIISPDYIQKCVDTLQRTKANNVGGLMTAVGNTAFGKAVAIATSTSFGIGNSKFHYSQKEESVDSVYMGAWPYDTFTRIGLFDEELVRDQDDEFNYRLKKFGGKIILNPEIKSLYAVRSSPAALFKQYFQYGLWKVRVMQKHPGQMSVRQFVPSTFLVSLLVSLIATFIHPAGIWFTLFILGSYVTTNCLASALAIIKSQGCNYLFLTLTYPILHVAYGSGFLSGLVKFWNRWNDKSGQVQFLN